MNKKTSGGERQGCIQINEISNLLLQRERAHLTTQLASHQQMQLLTQWGKKGHMRDVLSMSMPRSAGDGVEGACAPNKTEILARGRVVKYRDWMTCDIKAGLKSCLLA